MLAKKCCCSRAIYIAEKKVRNMRKIFFKQQSRLISGDCCVKDDNGKLCFPNETKKNA